MTSTRRTNLYKITAFQGVQYPVLSVGLTDLAESTVEVFAEIRDHFRIVGNGTFKPSFGEGIPTPVILTFRGIFAPFLHGHTNEFLTRARPYNHPRSFQLHQSNDHLHQ